MPGLSKGFSVKIMSVNPNGLNAVPILDDEGIGTGKKKEKLQMLKSMCSNHGVDILLWTYLDCPPPPRRRSMTFVSHDS